MEENDILKIKQELRLKVWKIMEEARIVRFPGAQGRIPNFIGAERAAGKVARLEIWQKANIVKCNPDSPQQPLRKLALEKGKIVYMAVPRLTKNKCFIELHPSRVQGKYDRAASIKGAFELGKPVTPDLMRKPAIIVAGSVAVNIKGARIGKGGGFSDLEYAIAREFNLVSEETPIITTIHKLQLIEEEIPMTEHDIPVDFIITPDKIIKTEKSYNKPAGIIWKLLDKEKIKNIPILKELKNEK
ncbi:5-formyltetrahydrofolate cyclo-ligase [candidate division KSB1 bacterium]|nr:MAG: 5-formyltetrahydrofolate cyclo-ligase [candidate division KSB1 bacterium]